MSHMWVIEAFFEKWVIAHYARIKSKFQNLKPYNIYFDYADFIFPDRNLQSWPSFEKLSPTFFGTSNFETWLSRDPITWHPEVRYFGYKITNFIILPPQKNFSRTLQILGFIAESDQYKFRTEPDQGQNNFEFRTNRYFDLALCGSLPSILRGLQQMLSILTPILTQIRGRESPGRDQRTEFPPGRDSTDQKADGKRK